MVQIQYEGKLYEVATSRFKNLLSDFQKHKPEVKQLLYARPLVAEDFENLTDESIVYASADSTSYTLTEGNVQNTESYYAGLPQLEYRNTSTTQNGPCQWSPQSRPNPSLLIHLSYARTYQWLIAIVHRRQCL